MSIIPGIVFSRTRWNIIRQRNRTMDREVYLDNDHLVDFRVEERTTGLFISDLQLNASLSRNPTGSAIQSFFLGPVTTSLVVASQFDIGTTEFISASVSVSILTETSQSFNTTFTGSNPGVLLTASLTEDPPCSGHYIGTIFGPDISMALSQSLSSSFSSSFSSSVESASFSTSLIHPTSSVTATLAFTASVFGFTSSFTESVLVQLVESDDRCFGVFELIEGFETSSVSGVSGSFLKASTPMTLRSVRFLP